MDAYGSDGLSKICVRSLSDSLRTKRPFPIPDSIELVQQERDKRLRKLEYLVEWTNAEVNKPLDWKVRAILDILTTDEDA